MYTVVFVCNGNAIRAVVLGSNLLTSPPMTISPVPLSTLPACRIVQKEKVGMASNDLSTKHGCDAQERAWVLSSSMSCFIVPPVACNFRSK